MNSNISNKNKIQKNSKINNTSSKPVKKMILWTRVKNSKSTSPHIKQDTNPNLQRKKIFKENHSGQKVKNNSKEKSTLSPLIKPMEVKNYVNNRNYLNNSRISTNKILNSQITSFQSNSNEENKSSSKFGDSNSKKSDKKPHFFNNIKFSKYINMNHSLNNNNNINSNNNVNINSSEYHINNTYKYFQASNGINLWKKNKNKINCITDNNHIFLNPL